MNARTSSPFTVARNASAVFGATVSAFAIADSTGTDTPSRLGETIDPRRAEAERTGRSNASVTASAAASGASPPIATPASVTPPERAPSAPVVVGLVVVVLVVVSTGGDPSASDGRREEPRRAERGAG